jgi:voltage-gated potassium channel Kch
VDFVRSFGNKIYFGDATRLDLLRQAGLERAKVFVLAIDDSEAALRTCELVRESFPDVKIVARARDRRHELTLRDCGVHAVVRETLHSGIEAADAVLRGLGVPDAEARASVETFREHDARTLETQLALYHDDEAFREAAKNAAEQLRELFEADRSSVRED